VRVGVVSTIILELGCCGLSLSLKLLVALALVLSTVLAGEACPLLVELSRSWLQSVS
jgi:hypothetical protein